MQSLHITFLQATNQANTWMRATVSLRPLLQHHTTEHFSWEIIEYSPLRRTPSPARSTEAERSHRRKVRTVSKTNCSKGRAAQGLRSNPMSLPSPRRLQGWISRRRLGQGTTISPHSHWPRTFWRALRMDFRGRMDVSYLQRRELCIGPVIDLKKIIDSPLSIRHRPCGWRLTWLGVVMMMWYYYFFACWVSLLPPFWKMAHGRERQCTFWKLSVASVHLQSVNERFPHWLNPQSRVPSPTVIIFFTQGVCEQFAKLHEQNVDYRFW